MVFAAICGVDPADMEFLSFFNWVDVLFPVDGDGRRRNPKMAEVRAKQLAGLKGKQLGGQRGWQVAHGK